MLNVDIAKNLPSFNMKVQFDLEKGVLGLLGSSGSGKSMTLKCIAGIETPSSGIIRLGDKDFFNKEAKINLPSQKRKIGYLFQNYALFPNMNVLENIEIGLISNNKTANNLLSKEYIERLGLKDLEKQYPWQLSGGQQQRVALGRALITEPDILLLDEPFSALDYHLRLNMEKELLSILKTFKGQVIFVTHDIEEAYRISDNIIVFDKGIATLSRDKNDLFKNPRTLAEATLTGCKNISKATKIDPCTIYAENWGIEYHFTKIIPDSITHIGIRAHYIEIISSNEDEYTYPFIVENIIENPFDLSVYVRTLNNDRRDIVNFFIDKRKLNFSINERVFIKFSEASVFYF